VIAMHRQDGTEIRVNNKTAASDPMEQAGRTCLFAFFVRELSAQERIRTQAIDKMEILKTIHSF